MSTRNEEGIGKMETILVVDDNRDIVFSVSELLKYEGYTIEKAYDGMEALDVLERKQIDLILLDVMMPRLNGLSTLMKIRCSGRTPAVVKRDSVRKDVGCLRVPTLSVFRERRLKR